MTDVSIFCDIGSMKMNWNTGQANDLTVCTHWHWYFRSLQITSEKSPLKRSLLRKLRLNQLNFPDIKYLYSDETLPSVLTSYMVLFQDVKFCYYKKTTLLDHHLWLEHYFNGANLICQPFWVAILGKKKHIRVALQSEVSYVNGLAVIISMTLLGFWLKP